MQQLTDSSQHFQKLRKDSKAEFGEPGSEISTSAAKGTPRKPKAAKTNGETPSKSTGKRRSKKDVEVEQHDDEGESPSKKIKSEGEGDDSD